MDPFYSDIAFKISRLITKSYSTSFSIAVGFLSGDERKAIYSIYGFVRFADEIVDTFHNSNKEKLLHEFERDYYEALAQKMSLNPVLHSFQITVRKYNIPDEFIRAFLSSMKSDLVKSDFTTREEIETYIYGSADVVGLMCLKVFIRGDENLWNELSPAAKKLGSAFQKVNFLRDLRNDTEALKRHYFPEMAGGIFNEEIKDKIIRDIEKDFIDSYQGLKRLPGRSKLAVYIAYKYYLSLLRRIKRTPAERVMKTRIRVPDYEKLFLLCRAWLEWIFKLK